MQVLLNCIYFILTLCIYLNIWLEYFNLSNRCLTEVKILILIIALCLFANILLLFINVMFFLNKSKQLIYTLVINNIISIITLLMCINYIKGLLIESKATKAVNKIFSFEFSFQSTISFFYKTILLKLFESHIHKENI